MWFMEETEPEGLYNELGEFLPKNSRAWFYEYSKNVSCDPSRVVAKNGELDKSYVPKQEATSLNLTAERLQGGGADDNQRREEPFESSTCDIVEGLNLVYRLRGGDGLKTAAKEGNVSEIRRLVQQGADIEAKDEDGSFHFGHVFRLVAFIPLGFYIVFYRGCG